MSADPTPTESTDTIVADRDGSEPEPETARVAGDAVLVVSVDALATVLEVRDAEDDAGSLCLRVEIIGVNGVDFTYDLGFERIDGLQGEHNVYTQRNLTIAIPVDSVDRLRGAVLGIPANPAQGGLVIRNPNRPDPMDGVKDLVLTGDIAEKVTTLLAEVVNPGLAMHGGFTSLLGVEGTRVFLTMGGGCHGCSMSAATMVQGIQTAINEAIPEVTEVIDATDHSAGENPFYS